MPTFDEIARFDEQALSARLDTVRAALTHAGEKGRSLEFAVVDLLRAILPTEYGISTGFVAYHRQGEVALSPQLDVVIYDAARCGPLIRLGSCDVFPLEAVFGYVEVKAVLRRSSRLDSPPADSLEACIRTNTLLGSMIERRFWEPVPGSMVRAEMKTREWTRLRAFIVSFETTGFGSAVDLAQRMADVSAHFGESAHVHGLLALGLGYFRTRPVDRSEDRHHVEFATDTPLATFRADLLASLERFPRFAPASFPALGEYFEKVPWSSVDPRPLA